MIEKTEWFKNCPKCRIPQIFKNRQHYTRAIRNNSICRKCYYSNVKAWNKGLKGVQTPWNKGKREGPPFEWLYRTIIKYTKERNIEYSLTLDEFLEFVKIDKCHYCFTKIKWTEYSTDIINKPDCKARYNLDRKDNNIGYTKDNCVVCCKRCNYAKSNKYSYKEWYGMTEYFRK